MYTYIYHILLNFHAMDIPYPNFVKIKNQDGVDECYVGIEIRNAS